MGRNYKNDKEDWVYVEAAGNDKKKHFQKKNYPQTRNPKQEGEEHKTFEKKEEHAEKT